MRGTARVWALARMGHGGLLVALQGGALAWALNTELPAFNYLNSANPTPRITTQTPRRDAAKGTADIVTICSFSMQGSELARTGGTLRAGEQQAVGTPGRGGDGHCDKKGWGSSKRAAAGGAAIGMRGTVGTVGRQGGKRRGTPRPVCGRAGDTAGKKGEGLLVELQRSGE